ncbi:MAG: relaxase/mobilization nuclease domain-containing protein, partial [Clostridia bacterium]|nr:relaxase/mobilization nuclease domain-containing protein [Clostridia bacterium]
MAVTKIWNVRSHLKQLIDYVGDLEKSSENCSEETLQALVEYGVDILKTEERLYVSTLQCDLDSAVSLMEQLNSRSSSMSETIAYHAYQSFKRGEVAPEAAHEIGVRLAQELWGNFPVVVSTHTNTGTIHNHFAFPATGFDMKRYHDCKETYRKIREVSDRLCREYGLSVIEKPREKGRHIGEIKAEQEGRATVRGLIRRDMDEAIKHCFTYPQFATTFQALGYTLEWRGKYLRIRPDESTRWFRMDKLG